MTKAGTPGLVEYERGLQRRFQNAGDHSGQRFRQERLLLPLSVMENGGGGENGRGRVGGSACRGCWLTSWETRVVRSRTGGGLPPFQREETGPARALLDDVLGSYPYNDAAHWLRAKTYESDGDHRAVLDSVASTRWATDTRRPRRCACTRSRCVEPPTGTRQPPKTPRHSSPTRTAIRVSPGWMAAPTRQVGSSGRLVREGNELCR